MNRKTNNVSPFCRTIFNVLCVHIYCCLFNFQTASASTPKILKIHCTHLQVCNLLENVNIPNITLDLVYPQKFNGDHHHFEPSPEELKQWIQSELLATPPMELQPWLKKILTQRNYYFAKNKSPQHTWTFQLSETIPKDQKEIYAHFWAYKNIACQFKKDFLLKIFQTYSSNLTNEQFILTTYDECLKKFSAVENQISMLLKSKLSKSQGLKIFLTHNALLPFFQNLFPSAEVISLKGSHEHEEIHPMTLKKILQSINHPSDPRPNKHLWVLEEGFQLGGLSFQNIQTHKNFLGKISIPPNGKEHTETVYFLQTLLVQLQALK